MIKVAAFYRFISLPDCEELQTKIFTLGEKYQILGTMLLAQEGFNSTIAGTPANIESFFSELAGDDRFGNLTIKFSEVPKPPFKRWKVKLKNEIVTMGVPGIDPNHLVGTYASPAEWNELIAQPDVLLIDCRNSYEFKEGTFAGAVDPETKSFNEFPEFITKHLTNPNQTVAMFCTGGIRCEKATAYMRRLGFENVHHLQGGILQYLQDIPESQSQFNGNCFVFDERRAVDQNLAPSETINYPPNE